MYYYRLFIGCFYKLLYYLLICIEIESLNEVAAHVLQPCEGTQDNMAVINLNTDEGTVTVSTPFGFKCATNYYCDVPPKIFGPCELDYLIIYKVRGVSCSRNFPGKNNIIVSHACTMF